MQFLGFEGGVRSSFSFAQANLLRIKKLIKILELWGESKSKK